jgi:sec-independent protein translocase protein TatA
VNYWGPVSEFAFVAIAMCPLPGRELSAKSTCTAVGERQTEHVDVGVPELLIILVVVLLVFGSKKLPELARSLGQASKEFRKGTRHEEERSDSDASSHGPTETDRED